jgi:hypothetical protein
MSPVLAAPAGVCVHRNPLAAKLSADAADMTVTAVISTAEPDHAGDVVVPNGLANRDEYLLNPVVLWAHRRDLAPVGTCVGLEVMPDRIVAVTRFARGLPAAEELFRLYEQGVLRGWSIGFIPVEASRRQTGRGMVVRRWKLLEYSAVPVPENPGALTVAVHKGLVRDATLRSWLGPLVEDPFADLVT